MWVLLNVATMRGRSFVPCTFFRIRKRRSVFSLFFVCGFILLSPSDFAEVPCPLGKSSPFPEKRSAEYRQGDPAVQQVFLSLRVLCEGIKKAPFYRYSITGHWTFTRFCQPS